MDFSLMLGHLLDTRVDVLHVVAGVGPIRIDEYETPSDDAEAPGSDRLRVEGFESLRSMAEGAGAKVRFLVGRGPLPGPVILDEARHEDTNLIVLGAHGLGAAEKDRLGSVSTEIVRRSTCPVLIIPPHANKGAVDEEMERVVALVSYTHFIEPVIGVAVQLADLLGARLDVLAQMGGVEPNRVVSNWENVERNLWQIIERHEYESGIKLPPERIALHPVRGDAVDEPLNFTVEHSADMLILGAPGLPSMESPSEHVVEEIVGRSPCPVILVNTCGRALRRYVNQSAIDLVEEPVA